MDSSPPQIPLPLSFGSKKKKPTAVADGHGGASPGTSAVVEDSSSTASTHRRRGGRSSYLRSGKWSSAEENYARCMILHFSKGLLQLRSGETLRLYMSKKLYCDPMRITKRFAGTGALMKEISQSRQRCSNIELALAKSQLDALEKEFLEEAEAELAAIRLKQQGSTAEGLAAPTFSVTESSSSSASDSAQSSVASLVNGSQPSQGASETLLHQPAHVPATNANNAALYASGISALLVQVLAAQTQAAPNQQTAPPPIHQGVDPAMLLALLGQLANSQPSPPPAVTVPPASNNVNPALLAALRSFPGFQQQQPQQPLAAPSNPLIQLLQQQAVPQHGVPQHSGFSHQTRPQQNIPTQQPGNSQAILQNLAHLMGSSPAPAPESQDAHLFLNFVNSCSQSKTS